MVPEKEREKRVKIGGFGKFIGELAQRFAGHFLFLFELKAYRVFSTFFHNQGVAEASSSTVLSPFQIFSFF